MLFWQVYKRGAVGRSIDITRYTGYDELKQDLARRFGIEGQLEDRQRIGWKLVYVDHENDVLLVGDDPWEYVFTLIQCILVFLSSVSGFDISNFTCFVQGIRELCSVHKDPFTSRGPANELGWRFWEQCPLKPSLQ